MTAYAVKERSLDRTKRPKDAAKTRCAETGSGAEQTTLRGYATNRRVV
jgi:hypothetical protein